MVAIANKIKSTLVVMATGLGKTIVMGEIASRWKHGRMMMLAHREELVFQAAAKISSMTGEQCGIEMGELTVNEDSRYRPRCVVSSVQTLNATQRGRRRMEKFRPGEFTLLMTDEAHHATAPTYRRVYEWFSQNPTLRHLGVTATPDRADEEALGQIFGSVAFEFGILDGINEGWLVPINQQFIHVEGLDLSACKSDRHDLKDADVARVMEHEGLLHQIVYPTIDIAGDRPTLVFTASVAHAHRVAEIFNRHRSKSAVAIDGTTDREERRAMLRGFARGEFQTLVNCGVFLEGFDEPTIEVVAMARPTKSRALYAQVCGRGTRALPGVIDGLPSADARRQAIASSGKPVMTMLDFVGNSGRHKLVCTADILGGNESDEIVDRATENAKAKGRKGEATDMQKELDIAREELENEAKERRRRALEEQEAARRAGIKARAKYSAKTINPFDVFDIVPKREPGWHKGRRATPGQKNALRRFKVDDKTIESLSFCQASQMMDVLVKRMKANKCSLKQARILARNGYSTDVSFQEASSIIDKLAKNGWKPF